MRLDGTRALLLALPLLGLLGLTGCNTVLPADLKSKLASDGSADDHMAAAMIYQNEAVITSYSIHYTKLYEGSWPDSTRERTPGP